MGCAIVHDHESVVAVVTAHIVLDQALDGIAIGAVGSHHHAAVGPVDQAEVAHRTPRRPIVDVDGGRVAARVGSVDEG